MSEPQVPVKIEPWLDRCPTTKPERTDNPGDQDHTFLVAPPTNKKKGTESNQNQESNATATPHTKKQKRKAQALDQETILLAKEIEETASCLPRLYDNVYSQSKRARRTRKIPQRIWGTVFFLCGIP